ncbi:MAG TPA: ATP-dependent DNA ligase, partial [Polyangiaceae bacterium]|nr:ATP-dependent DNA ligase [Polyangiaceae bacterium]
QAEKGSGSNSRRAVALADLFARATRPEAEFLIRLISGELHQGALEGVVIDAVASAFSAPTDRVRRAVMLTGSLAKVGETLGRDGLSALAAFELELFRPIQPMLADSAADVEDALQNLGEAAFEYKVDGARVQIHKDGDRVEVYSRSLNRVTAAVPEIVERVSALPARKLVLDGEAIALSSERRPLPFQVTMRRFGRKLDVEAMRAELPLDVFFFDLLRVDDQTLIDASWQERAQALQSLSPEDCRVSRLITKQADEADAFVSRALAEGYEGVMAKSLSAPYAAGRRGSEWLKLKPVHTLDLVVLAAEWGSGRRTGYLSNLHLGARDPDTGAFAMIGKTFKGMTDATLTMQTQALLAREIGREGHVVHVRPELVVEIAFNDVQVSAQYACGVVLRFARLKRYRDDKTAEQADTIERVRSLLPAKSLRHQGR